MRTSSTLEECMGRYGKGSRNENGQALVDWAIQEGAFLCNTAFQHVSMAKCTKSGLSSVVWTSPFSPLSSVLLFLERSVSSWCRKLSRTSYLVSDTEVIVLQVLIISMSISLNTRAELQARDFQSMAGLSTSVSEDYTSPKVPIMKGLYFPPKMMLCMSPQLAATHVVSIAIFARPPTTHFT